MGPQMNANERKFFSGLKPGYMRIDIRQPGWHGSLGQQHILHSRLLAWGHVVVSG
jgi:hypothetical protein